MNDANVFFPIGAFQVDNLMINNMPFLFLDLRADTAVPPELKKSVEQLMFWRRARAIAPQNAISTVQELAPQTMMPVLLLCEDGRNSSEVAVKLGDLGYGHILVVEGGIEQLAREWTLTTDS